MRFASIASSLLALSLVACGGSHLDAQVAKRLAVAKASKTPSYWLGPSYDDLRLVHVDSGEDAFFASELYYADCSWFELNTLSPKCHRVVEVDNDVPAPGEISTQGRCIFSTSIHDVTVATFPVNPSDLRVFARGATVMVSSEKRPTTLRAVAALRPLNGHPLRHRDVAAALGTCKAPRPKPVVHLTAKQRYDREMKTAFYLAQQGITISGLSPATAAKPKLVLQEFLDESATMPALLRNEADHLDRMHPPADAAAVHARIANDLRHYADVVDDVRDKAKDDALDERTWDSERPGLQSRLDAAAAAERRTLAAFRAAGYSTYVKPSD